MSKARLEGLGAGERVRKAYADMLLAQAVQQALYPDAEEEAERRAKPLKLPAPRNRQEKREDIRRRRQKLGAGKSRQKHRNERRRK